MSIDMDMVRRSVERAVELALGVGWFSEYSAGLTTGSPVPIGPPSPANGVSSGAAMGRFRRCSLGRRTAV